MCTLPVASLRAAARARLRALRVHDGAARVVHVVRAHQRRRLEAEDALERPVRSSGQHPVHLLRAGGALHLEHAVRERRVGQRHAHRQAVQLALELGEDERNRSSAARAGGRQVDQAAARAAQVALLGVGRVHQRLRVGQVVHRGDAAVHNAQLLLDHLRGGRGSQRAPRCAAPARVTLAVQRAQRAPRPRATRLDHGREAVGGAGRGGDDVVRRGVVQRVVHAHDNVEHRIRVLHRRGDDHLGRTARAKVGRERRPREEHARALEHQRHARRLVRVRQRGGLARRAVRHAQHAARARGVGEHHAAALRGRAVRPRAVHAVVLDQVRRALHRGNVVQVDELESLRLVKHQPQRQAACGATCASAHAATWLALIPVIPPIRPQPLIATLMGAIAARWGATRARVSRQRRSAQYIPCDQGYASSARGAAAAQHRSLAAPARGNATRDSRLEVPRGATTACACCGRAAAAALHAGGMRSPSAARAARSQRAEPPRCAPRAPRTFYRRGRVFVNLCLPCPWSIGHFRRPDRLAISTAGRDADVSGRACMARAGC